MIIFYSYNTNLINYAHFLSKLCDRENIVLYKYNKDKFDKADVIVPIGIFSQIELSKYSEHKNKFLVNEPYVYYVINNKVKFYKFIKKFDILKDSSIQLIPTFDKKYKGPNFYDKFIVKHKDGTGSFDNKIKKDHLYNLISKYGKNYQVQELIKVKYVHGINCLCHNGRIVRAVNFIVEGFIDPTNNNDNCIEEVREVDPKFLDVINKITMTFQYNGFIEFEFLEDNKNNIFLIEANPRLSGHIKCIARDKSLPYVDNLIIPYYDIILNNNNKQDLYVKNDDVMYFGCIKNPQYKARRYGVVEFKTRE